MVILPTTVCSVFPSLDSILLLISFYLSVDDWLILTIWKFWLSSFSTLGLQQASFVLASEIKIAANIKVCPIFSKRFLFGDILRHNCDSMALFHMIYLGNWLCDSENKLGCMERVQILEMVCCGCGGCAKYHKALDMDSWWICKLSNILPYK